MLLLTPLTGTTLTFPAATPRETATTGGINQVKVSSAVCASTPALSDSRTSQLHPFQKFQRQSKEKRPEWRMVLVIRELARYKVDIAALSETQFSEQGQLEEMARFTYNGTISEAFAVTDGVKQCGVLAPNLFSLMLSVMLMDAYHYEHPGIRIAYRTDGHLLNSRRMQAPTCVPTTTVHDLLFADDCAVNTMTEGTMQRNMNLFAAGCAYFGLTISAAKMVVRHQPPPNAE
ncbi:unnamed protein product [Schistocephalus solidus]|uniref:Reverse transcriptase domain-containing protein n=1 Tax=Schistocephalus solidus TaxID=70667 RepID=A0A183T8W8_SCHSO|nr:unnamed protein product [Schistocephalus solidus]